MARRTFTGALVGLAVGCLMAAIHQAGLTERWEQPLHDTGFRLRPEHPDSGQVVVIGITQDCIEKLGPPPWPRRDFGKAIRQLKDMGASVIAFDIFFPDPSAHQEDGVDDDEELADAMRYAGNVLLPVFDEFRGTQTRIIRFRDNIGRLTKAAAGVGHINVLQDGDGVVRRTPVRVASLARDYLQFGVAAASHHLGLTDAQPKRTQRRIEIGDLRIPVDSRGNLLINWRSDRAWTTSGRLFRFADLGEAGITAEDVRGKIVLIGQTSPGLPNADMYATPFGPRFGLLVQADVAESVVSGRHITPCPNGAYSALLLLLSVAAGAVFFRLRLVSLALSTAAMAALAALASFVALWRLGLLVDTVPVFSALTSIAATSLSCSWARARRQVERQEEALETLRVAGEEAARMILKASSEGTESDGLGAVGPYAASLSIPEVTPPAVLRSIAAALGAQYGFMRLTDSDGKERWLSTAVEGDTDAGPARQLAEAVAPLVDSDAQAILIPNVRRDGRFRHFADCTESALGIRLALGEHALATVILCGKRRTPISPTRQFGLPDARIASAMAPQGALLLDHARLHRSVRSLLTRVVTTLTAAVHAKDPYTRGHSERVAFYAVFLARAMGLPSRTVQVVQLGALLHDVGKIGIDEVLLRGKQRLDENEWAMVKQHPGIGSDIFMHMEELGFLLPALRHHHERYDGSGYPDGLRETKIPLLARIMAIADAFDAMTFERPYRSARLSFDEACAELASGAGSQFDPELAALFVEHATPDVITQAQQAGATRVQTVLGFGEARELEEPVKIQ